MTRAYLSLGGNLGDPRRQMAAALRLLDTQPGQRVVGVSAPYRTPPWGKLDQPDFLNACAGIDTARSATDLLSACLDVERQLHRIRGERWGPRTIDIDILDFGGGTVETDDLQLPHPRMRERAFVLVPLAEIAPDLLIDGRSVASWRDSLQSDGIVREAASVDWWRGEA
ncbi:2-amino-4-hydroxy-6-hydroxymethyldihydropteridine diphosphokinase [Aureimonas sp. AU12]|uniref:2-amino-4-hydroxy-6- hydroxymethyldihydropteridine diphosphokinase n=1 Tax=Aureimonas sp. AU12 TaxID=1638161 RepID=UPI0007858F9D|nr:2-amino-4-hydroxy-6-hydroxymethyldihydropteridine diphosphokinase [Aureimonas sp. AU12]